MFRAAASYERILNGAVGRSAFSSSKPWVPKKYMPKTNAIHSGEGQDEVTRASAPDLCMSTTFVTDKVLSFSAVDQDADDAAGYIYTRWGNPTIDALEQKVATLENAAYGKCFASGMAASTALLLGRLSAGDHVVCSNINYPGTAELFRDTLPRFGIRVSCVDTSDLGELKKVLDGENTKMIWLESPCNPILRLSDIQAVSRLAEGTNAKVAVDSTFATPIATRPLDLGADFVVHSLTKYIGGHGDALGGIVVGKSEEDMQALFTEASVHFGATISPFNAWLISRGCATLPIRMKAHEENAMKVASWLEGHPSVKRVLYPGLSSHPQHDLACMQMENFSGMMSFQVHSDQVKLAEKMMSNLEVIHYAVSLGHHRSLIYLIETEAIFNSSYGFPKDEGLHKQTEESYRESAGDGVFRFSVGLEDPDDLIKDLDRVLS